jgi:hypothetical protein
VTDTINPSEVFCGSENLGTIAKLLTCVAGFICNVNVAAEVCEFASVAVTVIAKEPVVVGVPEIRPLLLFKFTPVGKAPDVKVNASGV